ncbi:MAG: hypothetical protein ACO3A4_06095 [Silvanigrellaceae bacterium]
MKFKLISLTASLLISSLALAEQGVKFSLAMPGVTASVEKEISKPREGNQETQQLTAVDTFGLDGRSSLPSLEFGLEFDKYVVYAYPNAATGGRELWLGIKAGEDTEIGVLAGIQHLVYNPAINIGGKVAKSSSADRLGLFVNHQLNIEDERFDLQVTPWYAMVNELYNERSFDTSSAEIGVAVEGLWVWEIEENIEVGFGIDLGWSQSKEKAGGTENRTINWSRMAITLANTKVSF